MGILETWELGGCGEEVAVNGMEAGSKEHVNDYLGLWCEFRWVEDRAQPE
jgi:tyrosyl-DNA phosphodiesterase 2